VIKDMGYCPNGCEQTANGVSLRLGWDKITVQLAKVIHFILFYFLKKKGRFTDTLRKPFLPSRTDF
jgi:hypothetical protein